MYFRLILRYRQSRLTTGTKQAVNTLYIKSCAGVAGNTAARNDAHTGQASDALLDDILGDLGGAVPKPPPAQEALTAIRRYVSLLIQHILVFVGSWSGYGCQPERPFKK